MGVSLHRSLVTDENMSTYEGFFEQLDSFAHTTFGSYGGYEVVDVTDVSIYYDNVAEYKFGHELHRDMFNLYAEILKKKWPT